MTAPGHDAPLAPPRARETSEARALHDALIHELLAAGELRDPRVRAAMEEVPRHLFMPLATLEEAYVNDAVPIGYDQTISQPSVVAVMTDALALTGAERVLEIGTGSGYQAAILARLAREVLTIERVEPLADAARERLARLGYTNVRVRAGDGYAGWPEEAPFDRILVTAAPPELPPALTAQLAPGGILVAPVGRQSHTQWLTRAWRSTDGKIRIERLAPVRFVPMVSAVGSA